MSVLYSKNYTHSLAYYKSVLTVLIAGVKDNLTHHQVSDLLNSARILTPTGKLWSRDVVKSTLARIRNHQSAPRQKIHTALLQLICAGELTTRESLPLFRQNIRSML